MSERDDNSYLFNRWQRLGIDTAYLAIMVAFGGVSAYLLLNLTGVLE